MWPFRRNQVSYEHGGYHGQHHFLSQLYRASWKFDVDGKYNTYLREVIAVVIKHDPDPAAVERAQYYLDCLDGKIQNP